MTLNSVSGQDTGHELITVHSWSSFDISVNRSHIDQQYNFKYWEITQAPMDWIFIQQPVAAMIIVSR